MERWLLCSCVERERRQVHGGGCNTPDILGICSDIPDRPRPYSIPSCLLPSSSLSFSSRSSLQPELEPSPALTTLAIYSRRSSISFRESLPNRVPHLHCTSTSLARAFPGGNRRPYHRPPWERRPSSASSRRSASSVLLHPNRPWEWIPGELLHLPHPFPGPFSAAPCAARAAIHHGCARLATV